MAIMSPVFFLSGYVVNFLEWKLGYVQQQGLEEEGWGGTSIILCLGWMTVRTQIKGKVDSWRHLMTLEALQEHIGAARPLFW